MYWQYISKKLSISLGEASIDENNLITTIYFHNSLKNLKFACCKIWSMISEKTTTKNKQLSFEEFKKEILNDYRVAVLSRECSLLGRREVLTGKAKFGIFGDGICIW